ncbi:MAG TPA: PPC domain-containing DNA-binding protein [Candidatus Methylomirabilis sp.]|jgi:predicted DNA-binding protein with PD1-like motif|nr:PPC domain-containing DNA-binding protein [Candidatus Methylomirabilis sp.]
MISGKATTVGEVIVARLAHGEDLLESIAQLCREQEIRNGVILTGFGSVDRARFTGARSTAWPNLERYRAERKEGLEILAIAGVIADYDVQAHMVLSNQDGAIGGHLEPGCRILAPCELVIAKLEGIELRRLPDPAALNQRLLQMLPPEAPTQQDPGPWSRAPETIG